MGESLEIADHAPPPVPDPADNFAEAAVVRRLIREARAKDAGDEGPFPLLDASRRRRFRVGDALKIASTTIVRAFRRRAPRRS